MRRFGRIAVYCGSSDRAPAAYYDVARAFGGYLAARGIGVVYGGGRVGMMGAVADGALAAGGEVIGVITRQLEAVELGHHGLTELQVVDTMHTRKQTMASLADGFVALPGGWGTLEELFEAVTWSQLNIHRKPAGLLDVQGYFQSLVAFLDEAVQVGFVGQAERDMLVVASKAETLLQRLAAVKVPRLSLPR